ncbi:hypothetical protein BC629DRAFT_829155 [Irpex lacteus]|nr:hypothetical protein BC629DRAFT_829155 [Irpex lacteus]
MQQCLHTLASTSSILLFIASVVFTSFSIFTTHAMVSVIVTCASPVPRSLSTSLGFCFHILLHTTVVTTIAVSPVVVDLSPCYVPPHTRLHRTSVHTQYTNPKCN